MSTSSPDEQWVRVGRVGRSHGLDGSFYVSDGDARFLTVDNAVRIGSLATRITRRAGTDARPLVRVEGVSSREAIKAFGGQTLFAQTKTIPTLGPDEYWAHELEGAVVNDGEEVVGTVRRLMGLPSCEVLVVEREQRADLLVPLVRDAVRTVDVAAKRVEIDLQFLGESGSG